MNKNDVAVVNVAPFLIGLCQIFATFKITWFMPSNRYCVCRNSIWLVDIYL